MKKILIVEDNETILTALEMLLSHSDFDVRTTLHGEEAVAAATTFMPDIILLDLLLSGIDGGSVCESLKADKNTKHIPIIMMSAHPDAEKVATESGADGFIDKPASISEIRSTIDSVIKASSTNAS